MRKLILAAAVLNCALWTAACSNESEAGAAAPETAPEAAQPAGPARVTIPEGSPQLAQIKTEPVKMAVVPLDVVTAPAQVEANANRLSHVVLPVAGRILTVEARIGDAVKQGQTLVTLESPDAEQAVSAYVQAQAGATASRSALTKSQNDLDRQTDLFNHGATPEKELINARAALVQAQAGVQQADSAVEQAKRRLQILGLGTDTFGQTVSVKAPLSGKVLDVSAVNGEFRNDLSAPVMTVADLSTVWVTCDVPESAIRLVHLGEPIEVQLDAYPGKPFKARVLQIGDTVDPQSRTIKVRAELPNSEGLLKPQMFGRVQLTELSEPKPTVPAQAVAVTDGMTYVWRQVTPGVFERTEVTTGSQISDRLPILSGLGPKDSVVVDGVMLLQAN